MPIGQHWFRKSDMYFKVYVPKCPVRYLMRQLHLNSRFCCIYVKTISGCVLWSLRMYSFGTFQPTGYLPCFLDFHMHVIQGPLNTRSNRTLYQLTFKWPTVNYDFLWNYPVFTLNESMLPFSEISRSVLSLFLFQWRFLVCLAPWIQKLWIICQLQRFHDVDAIMGALKKLSSSCNCWDSVRESFPFRNTVCLVLTYHRRTGLSNTSKENLPPEEV